MSTDDASQADYSLDLLVKVLEHANEARSAQNPADACMDLVAALDLLLAAVRAQASPTDPRQAEMLVQADKWAEMRGGIAQHWEVLEKDPQAATQLVAALDRLLDVLLDEPSTRLAAYGSLMPGQAHADHLASCQGEWDEGTVTGVLGADGRYPALKWDPRGPQVDVAVFHSLDLPAHFPELDVFEGEHYTRILAPVIMADNQIVIANLYHFPTS